MKTVIIKSLRNKGIEIIQNVKDNIPAHEVVELWQKKQTDYIVRKELHPVSFKVGETNNFISCMVEGSRL